MGVPIATVVGAVATLANGVGIYLAERRKSQAGEPKGDPAQLETGLQADLQKQTAFIEALTKQVEALARQVERQQATIETLKRWLSLAFVLIIVMVLLGVIGLAHGH